jgi:hypothetical protein
VTQLRPATHDRVQPSDAKTTPPTRGAWYRVVVVGGILAGVGLRIALLRGRTGVLDSDAAVVGLMARNILHHHDFTAFYWGQNYGGSLTAIVMAGVFAVFGDSTATLYSVPLVMSAVASLLVWRLGRRTIGEPGATIAALAFWMWPTTYVWLSIREKGFYWSCLILGLAFLLAVLRVIDRPRSWAGWIALGFVGGLGWWTSPQILYFVVPGLLWLVIKIRTEAWRLVVALPAALIGSFPWFAWNLNNHWNALVPRSHQFDKGYFGNIGLLFREGLPVALGLNSVGWIVAVLFPILYVALLVLGAIGVALRRDRPWLLILVVVLFPLLWGAFPVSGVIGEGRYVMFILPALALLLMFAARSAVVQVLLLLGAFAVSVDGVHRIACCTASLAPDVSMPNDTKPLISALDRHHVRHFDGDYWIVYRVAFETHERITGSPRSFKRWPPYDRAVAADPTTTTVFVATSRLGETYRLGLVRLGVAFRRYRAGDFVVDQPARHVDFEHVLAAGAAP